MPTATLTSKGQITIPKKIRDKLGLKPGDKLNFEVEDNQTISMKRKKNLNEAFGMLHRENQEALTIEEMNEGVAEYFRKKYGVK